MFATQENNVEWIPSYYGSYWQTPMATDSPRSLEEPIFGFTSSPFASSRADIQRLDHVFDDYVSPRTRAPEQESMQVQRRISAASQQHASDTVRRCETNTATALRANACTFDLSTTIPTQFPHQQQSLPQTSVDYYPVDNPLSPPSWIKDTQVSSMWMTDRQGIAGASGTSGFPLISAAEPCSPNDALTSRHGIVQSTIAQEIKYKCDRLNEFRQKGGEGFRLSDLWGYMFILSRDQIGSRFLQQQLPQASAEEQERYFNEISRHALTISGDVFGNFIIQILLESNNETIVSRLMKIIKPHIFVLSTRQYGCRVVQKAIEVLDEERKLFLVSALNGSVESCAYNEHGNHVIQRCLQSLTPSDVKFIYDTISEKTKPLTRNKFGCRVVQRALEQPNSEILTERIRQCIVIHAVEFAFDEYGNFVVQKLLRLASRDVTERIVHSFIPHLKKLSCQKYPSNVVETALAVCQPETAERMKRALLGTDMFTDTSQLSRLINDRFGRFVVEKLYQVCTEEEKQLIRHTTSTILDSVKDLPTQKSLTKRLQRLLVAL